MDAAHFSKTHIHPLNFSETGVNKGGGCHR
jgi:hypothetical protein